jgi:hypothetical protein
MKLSQKIADEMVNLSKIKAQANDINQLKKVVQKRLDNFVNEYDIMGDRELSEEEMEELPVNDNSLFP